jgi:hypothetical protein
MQPVSGHFPVRGHCAAGLTKRSRLHVLFSGKQGDLVEAHRLAKAEHQIHVLHGLARGTLYQIVERRNHDRPSRDTVGNHADLNVIGVANVA